ncbi:MAG: TolC family protein [Chitinophagaceae bacterium]|nr:MAG: TolC family protein [Chitinophagaceae bacterium]
MITRTLIGLCCLIASFNAAVAQDTSATRKLSLQQAVDIAIKNNLEVQQGQFDAERTKVALRQARANRLPNLVGDVSHSANQGRSIDPFSNSYINQSANFANYSLNTGIVLFNGFFIQNSIKQSSLAYEASKLEYQQQKDNLTLDIILTYLQILNNQDQLAQALNQADITRQQVQRLEIMNADGAIAPNLLYDLRGQLASDELATVNSRNTLETNKLTLSQLMNVPYSQTLDVERLNAEQVPAQYASDIESIYQVALQQLAMVKAAVLRTKSAQKAVKVARGDMFPVLSLNGGLATNYSSAASTQTFVDYTLDSVGFVKGTQVPVLFRNDRFDYGKISYFDQLKNNYGTSVGIGLRIPLLNSLAARNRVALAKINLREFELVEETTRVRLKQAIEQAYFNMVAARDRYSASSRQMEAFRESFRAAEVKFNAGAINSVEYLNSKNFLDRANVQLIIAKYDYVLRTKILDYYQAKPLW